MKTKRKKLTWEEVKRELKPKFLEAGITSCELKWEGCVGEMFPSFAHSLRRRKIDMYKGAERERKLKACIRACVPCHQLLDSLSHEETERIVEDIILLRMRPVK